jgi:ABC-type microcin C transport system duplicated ATPase subunit YejF
MFIRYKYKYIYLDLDYVSNRAVVVIANRSEQIFAKAKDPYRRNKRQATTPKKKKKEKKGSNELIYSIT